jgi:hypothetical protein
VAIVTHVHLSLLIILLQNWSVAVANTPAVSYKKRVEKKHAWRTSTSANQWPRNILLLQGFGKASTLANVAWLSYEPTWGGPLSQRRWAWFRSRPGAGLRPRVLAELTTSQTCGSLSRWNRDTFSWDAGEKVVHLGRGEVGEKWSHDVTYGAWLNICVHFILKYVTGKII